MTTIRANPRTQPTTTPTTGNVPAFDVGLTSYKIHNNYIAFNSSNRLLHKFQISPRWAIEHLHRDVTRFCQIAVLHKFDGSIRHSSNWWNNNIISSHNITVLPEVICTLMLVHTIFLCELPLMCTLPREVPWCVDWNGPREDAIHIVHAHHIRVKMGQQFTKSNYTFRISI